MKEQAQGRKMYGRGFTRSRKVFEQRKKKNIGTQTGYTNMEIEEKVILEYFDL